MLKVSRFYIDGLKKKVFFGYKITNNILEVFVYDADNCSLMFPITVSHNTSKTPCAYVDFPREYYWLISYLEKYNLIKKTGKCLIKAYTLNEYRFDLSKMLDVSLMANSSISFIDEVVSIKKVLSHTNNSLSTTQNSLSINSYGLTDKQMKEALSSVGSSDEVEEAIMIYKMDHDID